MIQVTRDNRGRFLKGTKINLGKKFPNKKKSVPKDIICLYCSLLISPRRSNHQKYHKECGIIVKRESKNIWNSKNRTKVREQHRIVNRNWKKKNRDRLNLQNREYRKKFPEKVRMSIKNSKRKNIVRVREYNRLYAKRSMEDPLCLVKWRLRGLLKQAFKVYVKTGKIYNSKKYGVDYKAIIDHLKPFPEDLSKYHIDHIRPLCSFDLTDPEQVKQAFAPENHRWLISSENILKGATSDRKQSLRLRIKVDGSVELEEQDA